MPKLAWKTLRADFPGIFTKRAEVERRIGHTCIKGVYLDELCPLAGRNKPFIVDDCGIFCEILSI